jgi:predicted HTH domain antitoxin
MNALRKPVEAQGLRLQQYPTPPVTPKKRRKPKAKRRVSQSHRAIALELTVKLMVNGLLSVVAIAALAKLVPYHFSQQMKLREIRVEVKQTEERVNHLSETFSRTFDPRQTKNIMKEQSPKVDPNQRPIVWLEPQNASNP